MEITATDEAVGSCSQHGRDIVTSPVSGLVLVPTLVLFTQYWGVGHYGVVKYSCLIWVGWSGDQILVGMRFSAPIQTDRVAHPASCTMGAGSVSSGQAARAWR